jgi:hypothetical protein
MSRLRQPSLLTGLDCTPPVCNVCVCVCVPLIDYVDTCALSLSWCMSGLGARS